MTLFSHPDYDGHEGVYIFSDPETKMRAIIAVHNTKFGPGGGGMAGLALGGGKGVLLRPEGEFDRAALFASYGRAIQKVGGQYITAEDVGVSPDDMRVIKSQTNFVAGLDEGEAASGDPSPVTARGVFYGLQVAIDERLNTSKFNGLSVAVQGLGHVGYALCRHLHEAGAALIVADINEAVLEKAKAEFGAAVVSPEVIHAQDVDIFAPCALGGAVNADSVDEIKASIICGAANNQLKTPDMGDVLEQRGVLYCPDYVVNAGGIINVAAEVRGDYDEDWVETKVLGIKQTLRDIFARRAKEGSTAKIADQMAREKLA